MSGQTASTQFSFFRLKLLYFLFFSGMGVLLPYLPVFFESLNFSKSQIGVLSMLPNMGNILFAPICSVVGDTFHAHYELMFLSLITSTLMTVLMPYVQTFPWMVTIVLLCSFTRAPLMPQIDSLVMSVLPDRNLYGDMRLWGAVSFGIFSFFGGVMTNISPDGEPSNPKDIPIEQNAEASSYRMLFFTYALCYVLGGFVLLYLLNQQVLSQMAQYYRQIYSPSVISSTSLASENAFETIPSDAKGPDAPVNTVSALYEVFARHPEVLVFALIVFLSGLGSGVIDSFLFLRLTQLGASGYVLGVARLLMCMAEIPMFAWSGNLWRKYGTWRMLAFTQAAFVLRFAYYASLRTPWAVLPCEVLHGVTFATLWNVSCAYASALSPAACHSTMQTLLEGLHWGLGSGVGALVGGVVYDLYGPVALFRACGVLSFLALLLSLVMCYLVQEDGASRGEEKVVYDALASQSDHGNVTPATTIEEDDSDDDSDGDERETV